MIIKTNRRINAQINGVHLLALLPGVFYLANLIRMLAVTTSLYSIFIALAGVIGLFALAITKKYNLTPVWGFAALYLLTLVIEWLVIGNVSVSSVFTCALLIGISVLMILYPFGYKSGLVVFYLSAFMLIYRISIANSRRILTSSANYVSVVLLLAVFFYYISIENSKRRFRLIDILPAALCLILSIWAGGRGGILSCTFLLAMILLHYMRSITNKNAKRTLILIVILLVVCAVLYYKNFNIIDSFMGLGKWRSRGTNNSARVRIWMAYFSKVKESLLYLVFGAPLNKIPILISYSGNTHNSFIQLHAHNGLIMLAAIVVMIWKAGAFYLKQKKYLVLIMMITIIIRGLSDKFIFGQYGMPIMLYFILLPYVERQRTAALPAEESVIKRC